jgi:hypothetical protein
MGDGSDGGSGSDGGMDAMVDAPCNAPNIICSGSCIDPNTTDTHCGGCGTDCTTNTANTKCTAGICCAPGQINSSGNCCDSGQHWDNGICCNGTDVNIGGSANPLCCPSGDIDSNGHCCASGQHWDNGVCCTGTEVNIGGSVNPLCCPDGTYLDCNNTCVPPGGNDSNCGGCPAAGGTNCTALAPPEYCSSGICCLSPALNTNGKCCQPGQFNIGGGPTGTCCNSASDIVCGGLCVDPQSDDTSCGGCIGGSPGGTDCTQGGTSTDKCLSGICCPAADHYSSGICCPAGTDNTGGICCTATQHNSGGICCGPGTDNVGGAPPICCASGFTNCGGVCVNVNVNDNSNCGGCGLTCGAGGTSCLSGHCCATNPGEELCGGSCSNPGTDPNNCGGCGTACSGATPQCTSGICCPTGDINDAGHCCPANEHYDTGICCPAGQDNCGGTCVNRQNDNNNCGTCSHQCAALQFCSSGTCSSSCSSPNTACTTDVPPVCTNLNTDPNNCMTCGHVCASGATCNTGACTCPSGQTVCGSTCTDTTTDPNNCGGCIGSGGTACGVGQQCETGHCCNLGTLYCPISGTCSDLVDDPLNCGGCGNACSPGSVCTNGTCICPSGQQACGASGCKITTVDPGNCGSCGNDCSTLGHCSTLTTKDCRTAADCPGGQTCTAIGARPLCVSNSCESTCPAPLCKETGVGECFNPLDDNKHCGANNNNGVCTGGTDCTASGKVCSNGGCVTGIPTNEDTMLQNLCVGGGPPIQVPTFHCSVTTSQKCTSDADCASLTPSGQTCVLGSATDCTGNIAGTAFTFGMCSCTTVGPLSRLLQTDAFDSTIGAYTGPGFAGTACTQASDCGKSCTISHTPCATDANCPSGGGTCTRYEVPCVNHTCAGGGVGTNGTITDTADENIGGDLWNYATGGLATKGALTVLRRFYDNGPFSSAKASAVYGDSHVHGDLGTSGSGTAQFGVVNPTGGYVSPDTGTLYEMTMTCAAVRALSPSLKMFGTPDCVQQTVTMNQPCDCAQPDLIPVKEIVHYYSDPTHNNDADMGISPALFDNSSGTIRLDLPCGNYYFHTLGASGATITIVVHGHVGLYISGAIRISQTMILDLDPGATLDIFANVMNVSQSTFLGSPAYPRQTRMYFGAGSCANAGCSTNEDCCSGNCQTGVCVGGGGSLGQAISLSNSGSFNGLLWAGYGTFTHSNPLEMYGAIFTQHFDASGDTTIHYDNGIIQPNECAPPPVGGICDSCKDCGNQPCVNGACSSTCTADSQCCPPLHCDTTGSHTCTL